MPRLSVPFKTMICISRYPSYMCMDYVTVRLIARNTKSDSGFSSFSGVLVSYALRKSNVNACFLFPGL